MTATDTIFALSSGAGRSAVAVIRISGPATAALLERLAGGLPSSRSFALRSIREPSSGDLLDRAVVVWLPAPHSVTGEDCGELHLHGSPAVVSTVSMLLAGFPGVRPAEAGEFTRRAFLNGKMDLVEVEGLADLLDARTEVQRRQALRQMSGIASSVFDGWRQRLLHIRASIEAVVDFADEPGIAEEAAPGIDAEIRSLMVAISDAVAGSASAEIVRDGVRVVLAGLPNTGKSSLLNTLARRDAAIVSEVPGTTRDVIEVSLEMSGIPVILTDTAGLRGNVADTIEQEGIRRTRKQISAADVVVWVWSADVPGSEVAEGFSLDLVVQNKCDLGSGLPRNDLPASQLRISTRTGVGIVGFIEHLSGLLRDRYGNVESSLLVSVRQVAIARNSIRLLNNALECPATHLELKAEEIRAAADEIGRLTGKIDVEEWLGAIFSRFCIGK